MKRFIFYSLFFILPFFTLYAINFFAYHKDEGDLIRLGFLYTNPTPRSSIDNLHQQEITYDTLSGINFYNHHKYDILTIGDSFSEKKEFGYNNYLSKDNLSILHINRFISGNNPNQKLIELVNSSFFDKIQVKYVVLQNVEREFNYRLKKLDFTKKQNLDSLSKQIKNYKKLKPDYSINFLSKDLFKIPLTNILYNFKSKPLSSKTYKVKLNTNRLFTNSPDELLFYQTDYERIDEKNNKNFIKHSVSQLNHINHMLNEKGIKLIVLVAPDKYDFYYDNLSEKREFIEPIFFKHYNKIEKDYIDINAYKVLKNATPKVRDLYYYDDTHWSPKAAKIVAVDILSFINK